MEGNCTESGVDLDQAHLIGECVDCSLGVTTSGDRCQAVGQTLGEIQRNGVPIECIVGIGDLHTAYETVDLASYLLLEAINDEEGDQYQQDPQCDPYGRDLYYRSQPRLRRLVVEELPCNISL